MLDLGDPNIETPETVVKRIEGALKFVPPERLVIAPDCGMKYLSREVAFGKLKSDGRRRLDGARDVVVGAVQFKVSDRLMSLT